MILNKARTCGEMIESGIQLKTCGVKLPNDPLPQLLKRQKIGEDLKIMRIDEYCLHIIDQRKNGSLEEAEKMRYGRENSGNKSEKNPRDSEKRRQQKLLLPHS